MCHLSDFVLNGLWAVKNELLMRRENTGTLGNDPNWERVGMGDCSLLTSKWTFIAIRRPF